MSRITMRIGLRVGAAASLLVLAALGAGLSAQPAVQVKVPTSTVFEYAAKFVCGINGASRPLSRGSYSTAVNIHYPGDPQQVRPQGYRRKVAVANQGVPGVITRFKTAELKNDQAVEFDCNQIELQLQENGAPVVRMLTGFLVIQSSRELDVVAVYTAAPSLTTGQVASIHTERVPARRVSVPVIVEPEDPISK